MEDVLPTRLRIFLALNLLLLVVLCSCGGKIAKTGIGSVIDVNDWGVFSLGYPDGSQSLKRLDQNTTRKDIKIARHNRLKPARFVETAKGGTLTFLDGKTILYYDCK